MRGDRVRNKVGDTVGDKAPRSQNLAHTLGRREKSGHHPCFYRLKSNSFRLLGTNGQHGKHLQSRILQVSAPNLRTNPLVFLSSAFLQKKLSCPIWASKRVSCNNPWTLFWFLVNFGKCGLGLWFLNLTDIDPICSLGGLLDDTSKTKIHQTRGPNLKNKFVFWLRVAFQKTHLCFVRVPKRNTFWGGERWPLKCQAKYSCT